LYDPVANHASMAVAPIGGVEAFGPPPPSGVELLLLPHADSNVTSPRHTNLARIFIRSSSGITTSTAKSSLVRRGAGTVTVKNQRRVDRVALDGAASSRAA
jgi:hypothetical protein